MSDPMPAIKSMLYPELVHPEPRADEPVVYDHAAESDRIADVAARNIDPRMGLMPHDLGNVVAMIDAHRHATLALVAEQHLSNLIAAYAVHPSPAIRERIGKELGI